MEKGVESDKIFIFHQNIQSLFNKTAELEILLDSTLHNPIVLAFTEHWLVNGSHNHVNINGYNMVACFSRTISTRGGSCIFLRSDLTAENMGGLQRRSVEGCFECTAVLIQSLKLITLCIYRPPGSDVSRFLEILEGTLQFLTSKYRTYEIAICGDFNIDLLADDMETKRFNDLMGTFQLTPTISTPTRVTETSETLLDNIFVYKTAKAAGKVIATAISDHYGQEIEIDIYSQQPKTTNRKKITTIQRNGIQRFRNLLADEDWSELENFRNPNNAYNYFINVIQHHYSLCTTEKSIDPRQNRKGWITQGIRISSQTKRQLYQDWLSKQIDKQIYINYRTIFNRVIKEAKKMHNNRYIMGAKNKTTAVWNLVSQIGGTSKSNPKFTIESFDNPNINPTDTLNTINNHLINICPDITKNEKILIMKNKQSIFLTPVDENEIVSIIRKLSNTKSTGPDGIPLSIIKDSAYALAKPITFIINLCMQTGLFPDQLKLADVTLIHKNGAKDDIGNYRQISLLSNFSKIFENALVTRLTNFFEKHSIIPLQQNGFVKNRSTERAIFQTMLEVIDSLNQKQKTAGVFIDLSKAFDSVSHSILLHKLEINGIRGIPLMYISSYLTNRKQRITTTDPQSGAKITSKFQEIKKGVPQGSIIGPLLYIIYTQDLPTALKNPNVTPVLFADDTSIIVRDNTENALKNDIVDTVGTLRDYFASNNMKVNIEKTQLICFTTGYQDLHLTVNLFGSTLQNSDNIKFLGVKIDSHLNWKAHINTLANKIASFCYALRMISSSVNEEAALMAYHAYVVSRIRYGIIFWGNSTEVSRIFILQKRCIRTIFKLSCRTTCRNTFEERKLLTLPSMYILECVKFIRTHYVEFANCKPTHSYGTRTQDLRAPQTSFTSVQKSVYHHIVKIYNKLPLEWKMLPTRALLRKLKGVLIQHAPYDVKTFFGLRLT